MKYNEDNIVVVKTKNFALRVIKLCQYLQKERNEYVLSKQLLRCGTSVGANVREAIQAQSKKDFVAKLSIALKEVSETEYWLELLHESSYFDNKAFVSIHQDCQEITKILVSIIKTTKQGELTTGN